MTQDQETKEQRIARVAREMGYFLPVGKGSNPHHSIAKWANVELDEVPTFPIPNRPEWGTPFIHRPGNDF